MKRKRQGEVENITKTNAGFVWEKQNLNMSWMYPCIYPYITFKLQDVLLQWSDKEKVKKERNISHWCPDMNNKTIESKTDAGQKIIAFNFVSLLPQLNAVAL